MTAEVIKFPVPVRQPRSDEDEATIDFLHKGGATRNGQPISRRDAEDLFDGIEAEIVGLRGKPTPA